MTNRTETTFGKLRDGDIFLDAHETLATYFQFRKITPAEGYNARKTENDAGANFEVNDKVIFISRPTA